MVIVGGTVACSQDDSEVYRGRRLKTAALASNDQASVYHAALSAVFDVNDPALSLLLDPRLLPRTAGVGNGPRMSSAVASALAERGTVKGTCQAPAEGTRKTLLCQAPVPGYVVRFSEIFGLTPDSVQVYVLVQKYDTPASGATQALRFERVYQVVRHDGTWSATREGRLRVSILAKPRDIFSNHEFRAPSPIWTAEISSARPRPPASPPLSP